jgi:hypothetical protein
VTLCVDQAAFADKGQGMVNGSQSMIPALGANLTKKDRFLIKSTRSLLTAPAN